MNDHKLEISKDTRLCMSLSARPGNFGTRLHNHLYRELGLDFVYKAFTTQDLAGAIAGIRALDVCGCAISMPFKEACIPMLDALDDSAARIESVNTIVNDSGRLVGHNTDYVAAVAALERAPKGSRFVLRGSGGMAKAIASGLHAVGFRDGWIWARNEDAGRALASRHGFRWTPEFPSEGAEVLVNASPVGMSGGPDASVSAFPRDAIERASFAVDAVALPARTPFIEAARARHVACVLGDEITLTQSIEQFVLYTGVRPSQEAVARAWAHARG